MTKCILEQHICLEARAALLFVSHRYVMSFKGPHEYERIA